MKERVLIRPVYLSGRRFRSASIVIRSGQGLTGVSERSDRANFNRLLPLRGASVIDDTKCVFTNQAHFTAPGKNFNGTASIEEVAARDGWKSARGEGQPCFDGRESRLKCQSWGMNNGDRGREQLSAAS